MNNEDGPLFLGSWLLLGGLGGRSGRLGNAARLSLAKDFGLLYNSGGLAQSA